MNIKYCRIILEYDYHNRLYKVYNTILSDIPSDDYFKGYLSGYDEGSEQITLGLKINCDEGTVVWFDHNDLLLGDISPRNRNRINKIIDTIIKTNS